MRSSVSLRCSSAGGDALPNNARPRRRPTSARVRSGARGLDPRASDRAIRDPAIGSPKRERIRSRRRRAEGGPTVGGRDDTVRKR